MTRRLNYTKARAMLIESDYIIEYEDDYPRPTLVADPKSGPDLASIRLTGDDVEVYYNDIGPNITPDDADAMAASLTRAAATCRRINAECRERT